MKKIILFMSLYFYIIPMMPDKITLERVEEFYKFNIPARAFIKEMAESFDVFFREYAGEKFVCVETKSGVAVGMMVVRRGGFMKIAAGWKAIQTAKLLALYADFKNEFPQRPE
jgi:hypothetical protein